MSTTQTQIHAPGGAAAPPDDRNVDQTGDHTMAFLKKVQV
jgi:hypothetical protein